MKVIYKYPVPIVDRFSLNLPRGAQVLSVQMQYDNPQMWVLQDTNTDVPPKPRKFAVFGTGHQIPADLSLHHLGTIQMVDGALVWHVFEIMGSSLVSVDPQSNAEEPS